MSMAPGSPAEGGDQKPFRRFSGSNYPSQAYGHASRPSFSGQSYTPSSNNFPSNIQVPPSSDGTQDLVRQIRILSSQVEDLIDTYSYPIRPYIPNVGRFLIVVTFIEDSFRIMSQWEDQLYYLQRHRGFPWGISHMFLAFNIVVMLACSSLVITKRYPLHSVAGLLGVVITQGLGYGLITDLNFFLRNLSVIGGLLMVLSDSFTKSRNMFFAGLPSLSFSENQRRQYVQLAGRILLIFLFIGLVIKGEFNFVNMVVGLIGLGACVMVVVGFKAKFSALFLVMLVSISNLFNNWWAHAHHHPDRDFLKYDFFQTLSIVGGLILLVNMGPGELSVDEKKKTF